MKSAIILFTNNNGKYYLESVELRSLDEVKKDWGVRKVINCVENWRRYKEVQQELYNPTTFNGEVLAVIERIFEIDNEDDDMVCIGFCKTCDARIFKDDVEGKDYYQFGEKLICKNCIIEYLENINEHNEKLKIVEKMQTEIESLKEHVQELEQLINKQAYDEVHNDYLNRNINDAIKNTIKESQKLNEIKELQKQRKQMKRDKIIEKAKQDIKNLRDKDGFYNVSSGKSYNYACNVEFVVDREERMVTAILRGRDSNKMYAYGIAQCHPDDCFNIHLGKVIALYKALNLKIPYDYYNVPQPTEVRVGDIVRYYNTQRLMEVISDEENSLSYNNIEVSFANTLLNKSELIIVDDSKE